MDTNTGTEQPPEEIKPDPAVAEVTPPAEETPAAETESKRSLLDPLVAAMEKDLGITPEIKAVDDVEEAAPATPEVTPAPAATPEVKPEAKAEPVKPRKKKATFEAQPEVAPAAAAPVAPPATPTPAQTPALEAKADPDADYIAGLNDDQKEELAEAGWAEKNLSKPGARKKLLDWFRKLDAEADRILKEDPDAQFNDSNEAWKKFVATKPGFTKTEQKRIIAGTIREAAEASIREEQRPQLEQVQREAREASLRPDVEISVGQFKAGLTAFLATDEDGKESPVSAAAKALAADPVKARAEYGLEVGIIEEEQSKAELLAKTYTRFTKGLEVYDQQKPDHAFLANFIRNREAEMNRAKPEHKKNGERTWIKREDMLKLIADVNRGAAPASVLNQHWTFEPKDILAMLARNARYSMEDRIAEEEERAAKFGYTRPKKASAQTPKEAPAVAPLNPPKARTTPSGGVPVSAPKEQGSGSGLNITETLGYKF